MYSMKDKVVIITGGGSGIGFGIATAFAKEGASLVLTGRTEGKLIAAQKDLNEKYGVEVLPVIADGASEEDINNVIKKTVEKFKKIDVVINNAQCSASGVLLEDHTKEDFDKAIYSGLYGTFFMMKSAFPYLKETKGRIINFGSGAGLFGKPGQSSYAAAKEGIRGLSRVAATEWSKYGITINVICPLCMTPALKQWQQDYPELYNKTIQGIPMGRFADAEHDIGGLCLYLASDSADYITGECFTVQGGSGLRP